MTEQTFTAAQKRKARDACHQAVRVGNLIRGACEKCGTEKTQAHHDDYSKPLMVRWLCQKHHQELHPGPLWGGSSTKRVPSKGIPDVADLVNLSPACSAGHNRTISNTYKQPRGSFSCRECAKASRLKWRYTPRGMASQIECDARYRSGPTPQTNIGR